MKITDYSEYTYTCGTDPVQFGSGCSDERAKKYARALADLVSSEFPGINAQVVHGEVSNDLTGPDEDEVENIRKWVGENWTSIL